MAEQLPIYKQINGELVSIEKRDPKRRYASVAGPDGNYLKEFTDEEERERDAEEARWEAEAPQREADSKRRKEEAERFKASLKYEYRLVAFLDVLGWSVATERSSRDAELATKLGLALATLRSQVQMADWKQNVPGGWRGDPQVTQLSDTIVLSFSLEQKNEQWIKSELETGLFWITGALLNAGLLIRGAVVPGLLVHRGTIVYGPALLQAYRLGDEHGQPPRIILHESLSNWTLDTPVTDVSGALLGAYKSRWRKDRDGKFFFDFLQDQFQSHEKRSELNQHHLGILSVTRDIVASNLHEFKGLPELDKYLWLAEYFNAVHKEYGVKTFNQIQVRP